MPKNIQVTVNIDLVKNDFFVKATSNQDLMIAMKFFERKISDARFEGKEEIIKTIITGIEKFVRV